MRGGSIGYAICHLSNGCETARFSRASSSRLSVESALSACTPGKKALGWGAFGKDHAMTVEQTMVVIYRIIPQAPLDARIPDQMHCGHKNARGAAHPLGDPRPDEDAVLRGHPERPPRQTIAQGAGGNLDRGRYARGTAPLGR